MREKKPEEWRSRNLDFWIVWEKVKFRNWEKLNFGKFQILENFRMAKVRFRLTNVHCVWILSIFVSFFYGLIDKEGFIFMILMTHFNMTHIIWVILFRGHVRKTIKSNVILPISHHRSQNYFMCRWNRLSTFLLPWGTSKIMSFFVEETCFSRRINYNTISTIWLVMREQSMSPP